MTKKQIPIELIIQIIEERGYLRKKGIPSFAKVYLKKAKPLYARKPRRVHKAAE